MHLVLLEGTIIMDINFKNIYKISLNFAIYLIKKTFLPWMQAYSLVRENDKESKDSYNK